MAEEMTEKPTEGTTPGGKYLTRDYLVINLQKFWNKIKAYIGQQTQLLTNFIGEQIDLKADQTDLNSLESLVNEKANESDLNNLRTTVEDKVSRSELTEGLAGKVNAVEGQGLSTNDFTDQYKNKLDGLKNYENATTKASGLMSAMDKTKLENIDSGATKTVVDAEWDAQSTNPAQSRVIGIELAKKADIETLEDPSNLISAKSIGCSSNDEGHIIFEFPQNTQYVKIHTSFGENFWNPVEKFSIIKNNNTLFTTFQTRNNLKLAVIENPEGKYTDGNWKLSFSETFKFYIENLIVDGKKYKPFVATITRGSMELAEISKEFTTLS